MINLEDRRPVDFQFFKSICHVHHTGEYPKWFSQGFEFRDKNGKAVLSVEKWQDQGQPDIPSSYLYHMDQCEEDWEVDIQTRRDFFMLCELLRVDFSQPQEGEITIEESRRREGAK